MYMHTRERIYPGIAAFDALTVNGESREQAADFIEDYYAWRSRRMADMLHRLMKIPGCCRLVPKFFKSMTRSNFGPKAGFQAGGTCCDFKITVKNM